MKKTRLAFTVFVAGLALGIASSGCGNHADSSGTLAQQKASVLGGPAPASEQANIAKIQAANAQNAAQAQKAQSQAQKPPK